MLLHERSSYASPSIRFAFDCKSQPDSSGLRQLRKDIDASQQIIDDLDPGKYPQELSAVVTYLREQQSFWVWQAKEELNFLQSGEVPALVFNNLDMNQKCGRVIDRMRNARSAEQACNLTIFEWQNCTLGAREKLGKYPKAQWDSFLKSRGIHERLIMPAHID